jgi:hypothetical protein
MNMNQARHLPAAFRVQKFLGGLRYPAAKPEIVAWAKGKGADRDIVSALQRLPERSYDSPVSLARVVAG